jgi:hypothetical protein
VSRPTGWAFYAFIYGMVALVVSGLFLLDGGLEEAWLLTLLGVGSLIGGAADAGWLTPGPGNKGRVRHEV